MAGLGSVRFAPAAREFGAAASVMVSTDWPLAACMAAQYAGWEIKGKNFFAMGSGPMRAAAAVEPFFTEPSMAAFVEKPEVAVGVLECAKFPPEEVLANLAAKCGVESKNLIVMAAPTRSLAGTVQIVARSIETAMHKLHELGFDLTRVASGIGTAPLPPPAENDLAAIGRTNDAILYGGEVTLFVRGDNASLEEIGPQIPSASSLDHGEPFAKIFSRFGGDFYKLDRRLFSPAVVTLSNLDTGRSFRFGAMLPEVVRESFGTD